MSLHLLSGEFIDFNTPAPTKGYSLSDINLEEKYAAGSIRIVTEQARYQLPQIINMVASDDYRLDPEFQRRHRWGIQKKSRLIESFIINVPVPPIYLYEVGYAKYEVMDGLQRLLTICDFYRDAFVLEGLEEWPELNGRKYSTLPDSIKRGIDRRYLSSIILLRETAKDSEEAQRLKQLVFERINSGGVKLSDQETRNAIFNGPMNRLCLKLGRNEYLCRTWGIPTPDANEIETGIPGDEVAEDPTFSCMEDAELVLRFFAYRQRVLNQDGSLRSYFDKYLQYANAFDAQVLIDLEHLFEDTIKLAHDLFGEQAFWLYRQRNGSGIWYKRPTTSVYDPMMFALSQNIANSHDLIAKRGILLNELTSLYITESEEFKGRYTNKENLHTRNRLFEELLIRVINQ